MKKLLFIVTVMFLSVLGLAQDNHTLKEVQSKFLGLNSFKVSFHQVIAGKSSNSGTLYYQKENKTKLEMTNLILATDGTTTWSINKRQKKATLSKYKANDVSLISLPTLLIKTPASCRVTESEAGVLRKIVLTPLKASLGFHKAEIFVNAEYLITKITVSDSNDADITFELHDYQLNIPLGETFFTYKEQNGVKTIDLR
jgi:outer membrane lipoprotein-sorting protein